MFTVDLGCGLDPERWMPGADLLVEFNFDISKGDPDKKGRDSLGDVGDNSVDMIWYSYGFRLDGAEAETARHIDRVCKEGATLLIRDYFEEYDWGTGECKSITVTEVRAKIEKLYPNWNIDSMTWNNDGLDLHEYFAVLTRGWG